MPSVEGQGALTPPERQQLIALAWDAIRLGLAEGVAPRLDPLAFPAALRRPAAAFVTLHHGGRLRGCVGHLEAHHPLALDVADNAFAAAFRDHRFAPLAAWELADLALEISVLTPPEPLVVTDEADLLRQLKPGLDGLILEDDTPGVHARGTFLPSVWETLPQPRRFVAELKRKAGLPADYWSNSLRISRYRTETFDA